MSELIACDRCGRSFATDDAFGMLAAITGPCPTCGGRFELAAPPTVSASPARTRHGSAGTEVRR